jgi:hypothetical protein
MLTEWINYKTEHFSKESWNAVLPKTLITKRIRFILDPFLNGFISLKGQCHKIFQSNFFSNYFSWPIHLL